MDAPVLLNLYNLLQKRENAAEAAHFITFLLLLINLLEHAVFKLGPDSREK